MTQLATNLITKYNGNRKSKSYNRKWQLLSTIPPRRQPLNVVCESALRTGAGGWGGQKGDLPYAFGVLTGAEQVAACLEGMMQTWKRALRSPYGSSNQAPIRGAQSCTWLPPHTLLYSRATVGTGQLGAKESHANAISEIPGMLKMQGCQHTILKDVVFDI